VQNLGGRKHPACGVRPKAQGSGDEISGVQPPQIVHFFAIPMQRMGVFNPAEMRIRMPPLFFVGTCL